MINDLRRRIQTWLLVATAIVGAQSSNLAFPRSITDRTQTGSEPKLSSDSWVLQDDAQTVLVSASNGQTAVFAGVQCDPIEPRARWLIFGALRKAQPPGLDALLHKAGAKLSVSTNAQSLSTQFNIRLEDRHQSTFGGKIEYTTANLNQPQFDALNNARDFAIRIGALKYRFSGNGSTRNIGAMACQGTGKYMASRLIESRRDGASSQIIGNWGLIYHSGAAALVKGRAEAYASTTSPSVEPTASFKFGVSCLDRQLYAHISAGINPEGTDDNKSTKTNAFIHEFVRHGKVVEVYRTGKRVATILVGNTEMTGFGHALSRYEMAGLMESDVLVVVGGNKAIEFSMGNSTGSLQVLTRICSSSS